MPWAVCILAESLSVTLLKSSFLLTPILASFCLSHFSMRSACFLSLSICCSRLGEVGKLSSSSLSASIWSFNNRLSFCLILRCFFFKSATVPLDAFDALDGSFSPSKAKKVPPKRPSCSQTNKISQYKGSIWSCIDDTKAAMVLWSGRWLPESAIKVTFSQQARSISRDDISPRA